VEEVVTAIAGLVTRHRYFVLVDTLFVGRTVVLFVVVFIVCDCLQFSAGLLGLLFRQPCFNVIEQTVIVIDLDRGGVVLVEVPLHQVVEISPGCVAAENKCPSGHLEYASPIIRV
jgi:hypothetical protein